MATGTSSPLRNEAVEYIHSEIDRVGVEKIDRGGIVRTFMAKGASRARIFAWIAEEIECIRNPPPAAPDPLEVEVAQAEALIQAAERAAVLNALPSQAEIRKLAREAREALQEARSPSVPDSPLVIVDSPGAPPAAQTVVVATPSGASAVMVKLERAMETVEHCITYSYGDNGKVRNPRMALAAAETLRKCLETALKLHEAVDNVQAVQRFMDECMGALREVSPEVANLAIERLRGVTARWAK